MMNWFSIATAAGEVTHTEEASTTEIATEQSSLASSTSTPPSVSYPASTVFSPSSTEAPNSPKSTSTETSTTLSSRIFPTTVRHRSTRRPQRPLHIDDESEEEESDTGVVDIKKKPTAGPTRRRRPVKPAVWDAEDDRIEKDIITVNPGKPFYPVLPFMYVPTVTAANGHGMYFFTKVLHSFRKLDGSCLCLKADLYTLVGPTWVT